MAHDLVLEPALGFFFLFYSPLSKNILKAGKTVFFEFFNIYS